ncbi:amidase domain-containing protein [Streptomyces sp. NPDC048357]|uniref:amidase domain-containing protein n=1 Tax=Streptomyces sp. NPDC048357 TaxID=3154719 RepID=UPI0034158776
MPPVWVESGNRAALQIPEGKLTDGAAYRWSVRACTSTGCSPWSAEQNMTVRVQALPPMPATQSLVLGDAALDSASVATDCATAGCATPPTGQLRLGTADGHTWATRLKANFAGLPPGARVTSAKLSLTRADCTTQCVAQKPDVFELSAPWTPAQSGKDLLTAAGTESYASDIALNEIEFGMLVQSWLDRGENEGVALTVPGTAQSATYHSGAATDATTRPKLTIEYLPPTVPGAVSDVVATAGDTGLLATWNAPVDGGATGETTYVVKAEKSDGTVVGTWEGTATRAAFTGLDNALSYRVAVTAKNAVGTGPVSRSALVQGASVPGGATRYKDYVQAYLSAQGKLVTGVSPTAADAAAASPHGTAFGDFLGTQEGALVATREALEGKGQAYVGSSSALTDTVVTKGSTAGLVLVRTTVVQTMTVRIDGVDQVSEDTSTKRFVFGLTGDTAKLESESDDTSAGQTLSTTATAGTQVVATPAETGTADDSGALALGADGFPVEAPIPPGAQPAAYFNSAGAGAWAFHNTGVKKEYDQDCTNFASKALYYGGGMRMRTGWYRSDGVWWKNPSWAVWPKSSYTWSGAENLRRHLLGYRSQYYVTDVNSLRSGDLLFFKWRKEPVYNHAAVVTGRGQGQVNLAQHGWSNHTTLNAAIGRYRGSENPIVSVVAIRLVSTN